jgi:hypothetical protein
LGNSGFHKKMRMGGGGEVGGEFTRGSCSTITCQEGQALDSSSEEAGLIKRTRFVIYKFHWMIELLLHSAHALPAEVAHERARGGQLFAGRLKKEKDDECRLEREVNVFSCKT